MAEQVEQNEKGVCDEDDVDNPNYKAPAQKSISELEQLDADDESLQKYKATLLGNTKINPPRPDDPRNVIVEKIEFCADDRTPIVIDTTGKSEKAFVVKEGAKYRLKIYYFVQREIVSGLRYTMKICRKGIPVDKNVTMVGSYGPKSDEYTYQTVQDELPSGLVARGSYVVKNKFVDDDGHVYMEKDFKIEIKKDWEN